MGKHEVGLKDALIRAHPASRAGDAKICEEIPGDEEPFCSLRRFAGRDGIILNSM